MEGGGGFPAVAVTPGVYTLTETGSVDDYVNGTWSCAGGPLVGDTVTVPYGGNVVCSITNTYTPAPPTPTAVASEVLALEILPETGADSASMALIASSLIVAGGCAPAVGPKGGVDQVAQLDTH